METNRSPVNSWYPYKVNVSSSPPPPRPLPAFLTIPMHEAQNSSAIITPMPPTSTWIKIKCHRLLEVIKHSILINATKNTIYVSFYFIVSLLTVDRICIHRITLTLETRLMKPYLVWKRILFLQFVEDGTFYAIMTHQMANLRNMILTS